MLSSKVKRYCFYNSISNFICGVETTMSTHSMFYASNYIEHDNIDVYSILYNITIKDFIGQSFLIPIYPVMSKFSKYGDKEPLKFLGLNIGIFEFSTILEHCTILISESLFIPAASIANIGKTISLTGQSSFNIKVINKISNNDVIENNTKISTISTVSFGFGTIFGLAIVKMIPCYNTRLCLLPLFGLARYYITLKSVKDII